MFLFRFSLLSKTVPGYLYSVTFSTFTPSLKRSGMTVGDFLKSISISLVFFTFKSRELSLHQLLNLSTSANKQNLSWKDLPLQNCQSIFIGVVSVLVQSFVQTVKRIGDRTVPCGEPVEIERKDECTAW